MENKDLFFIQNQICYNFKNTDLLQQAFVRRSYAKEKGGEDNEVLEFIGDKVLDFIVVKLLAEEYGYMTSDCEDYDTNEDWNEFCCEYREGKLTEIKKHLVEKEMLAHRIDMLGLADYLIVGKSDEQNNIREQASVKEDLFEAIIGAIALDCKWNIEKLQDAVKGMLNFDENLSDGESENYIQLVQDWCLKQYGIVPIYQYDSCTYNDAIYTRDCQFGNRKGIVFNRPFDSNRIWGHEHEFMCMLYLGTLDEIFVGFGESKSDARRFVCENTYKYLDSNDLLFTIRDEIDNPNKEDAINQLEILARRGYFSIPTYDYSQSYDRDGNPVWKAECHIAEYDDYFVATSSSKKDAKKSAAFNMLNYVLED